MAQDGGNSVPRITKAEHIGLLDTGDNIEAKRVANYVWNSGTLQWQRATTGASVTERYDYAGAPIIYVGEAPVGTSDATELWTINKFDLADSSEASGKVAYAVAWDDRAGATYE